MVVSNAKVREEKLGLLGLGEAWPWRRRRRQTAKSLKI
jgi:hypothetical protein